MKRYIFITFSVIILLSCGSTCEDVKKYCMSLSYSFKVTGKSKDREIDFKGFDKNKKYIEFKEAEHWNIYDYVEIGDSIVKELGKAEIKLIKRDTTLVFPLICGGRVVE